MPTELFPGSFWLILVDKRLRFAQPLPGFLRADLAVVGSNGIHHAVALLQSTASISLSPRR